MAGLRSVLAVATNFAGKRWPSQVWRNALRDPRAYSVAILLSVALIYSPGLIGQDVSSATRPKKKPTSQIDLSTIDYHEPSRMDRLSEDQPNVTLDFVDSDHVLLTFNRKKMFQRLPECTSGHEDRVVHAAILDVHSGRVVNETDWYLHDRKRYLWPMGSGRFLLRRLNDLFILDSSFHEKLLLDRK